MTYAEYITQCLQPYGWQPRPVFAGSERDCRLAIRAKSSSLEIDHRPARGELWLWILGVHDRRCLGLKYGDKLREVLIKIVEMQDQFSLEGYLSQYLAMQGVCEVSIIAWEQFKEKAGDDGGFNQEAALAQAQAAAARGPQGDPDPVVFPGQRVAKLSDYVGIMKRMQTGDMMGALGAYGLDMMSWGQVASSWGTKMAADPNLTQKFAAMMAQP